MPELKTYTCQRCGKEFQATQPAKWCSSSCKHYGINHKKAKYECLWCGKVFEGSKYNKPRFCSTQCSSAAVKDAKENPDSPMRKYVNISDIKYIRICTMCGRHFDTKRPENVNRVCPKCSKKYHAEYSKDWIAGRVGNKYRLDERELDSMLEARGIDQVEMGDARPRVSSSQSPVRQPQTREEINARRRRIYAKKRALGMLKPSTSPKTTWRQDILKERGASCSICGYNAYEDALQIHHKDMDRTHNEASNLIVLCANCHAILHQRIKKSWYLFGEDKLSGILDTLDKFTAEVKHRNKAGTPDMATRTEGSEQSESGATHSGTSQADMNHHEAGASDMFEQGTFF